MVLIFSNIVDIKNFPCFFLWTFLNRILLLLMIIFKPEVRVLNPFSTSVLFLYPLKTLVKTSIFSGGVEVGHWLKMG